MLSFKFFFDATPTIVRSMFSYQQHDGYAIVIGGVFQKSMGACHLGDKHLLSLLYSYVFSDGDVFDMERSR